MSTSPALFPVPVPYDEGALKVSDIHTLWYAQYGNPEGMPVVVIHGGPGAGCGPNDMRYFDPQHYRIILFDQRGAKRSKPLAEMRDNTPQHLVSDMEQLRAHLKIDQWLLFGGSWGSTLAMAYGQAHPERCLSFILRGIFLARKQDWLQVWYGMQDTFPEVWEEFQQFLPPAERDDLVQGYYRRLMDPDPTVHGPAARLATKYDMTCAFLACDPEIVRQFAADETLALGMARTFAHYCVNDFFWRENQILDDLSKIKQLPAIIVHGRYDIICRAKQAYELHQQWPGSELIFVAGAGHSALEPGITQALVAATEKMKGILHGR